MDDDKKVSVEISEATIARVFLNLGGSFYVMPYEAPGQQKNGTWHTVKISQGANRRSLTFVLECNGMELNRAEIPIYLLFDWLPRMLTTAEKADLFAARAARPASD